ncbi:hypothetical protein [Paracoccus alkanivorans]|uniref:Uncharacterized protein n=1 Tax=Paracoccus alkanivorans TaxID=2116655 RepID=A0A3M0M7R2_9RHOB|nr:hypothetical protein [Paracoccus alkanivorans]RMC33766.1 hypothetical protein C9E81_15815 [Paracoccus alkanivorans]
MTDREHLYICEECGQRIYPGDKFQPAGECAFCPEHAATLADILDFWERDIADETDMACWSEWFGNIEDARAHVENLCARIANAGAEFKPLEEA